MDITNNNAVTKTVWLIVAIVLIAITSFFGFKMSFADEGNINRGNEESSLSDKKKLMPNWKTSINVLKNGPDINTIKNPGPLKI